ncbi:MAG TPA: alpha-glucuronidase family glycosyl hydrolase [Terriglobales bacterium]|jgi:alpha-glucuronidase|nr:alpha-glucuronidase family glycosyl hydrolase [Terriglobales bacterium]
MKTPNSRGPCRWYGLAVAAILFAVPATAETGHEAWLRYARVSAPPKSERYDGVVVAEESEVLRSAERELLRGMHQMWGLDLRSERPGFLKQPGTGFGAVIVLGTLTSIESYFPVARGTALQTDGYWLKATSVDGHPALLIAGANDRGVLYGVFALLRRIALQQTLDHLDEKQNPSAPIRWINQWDNLDGSIERGYGGRSIFFANGNVVSDLGRAQDYARLLASVGINGVVVNNVNADTRILSSDFLPQLARIAAAFQSSGIRLAIAVDFASPQKLGGLDTFDPLDPRVENWWKQKADEIYRAIPDFAGFLMKADSEGRQGPSAYGRTHAQAANAIARALKPHGGVLIYRAFVYNHHLDWNDLKADRARAAYDNFAPLDGQFDDNAIVQIKYGPIDFQVREPVSPLIGALQNTNQVLELQITQEYTGQQKHLCFLAPMWKEILNFDFRVNDANTPVKEIVSGRTFHRAWGGFVGVANVGDSDTWLGFDLAQSNLYAFGRLAWDPSLSARDIADEWTLLTFGNDPEVLHTIVDMQMESWSVYEKYTGAPLGLQTLTNIVGTHYDPGPESADGNGWGQWIRADHAGVGMDRKVATGTGLTAQYPPSVAATYESLRTCPDNLLLFFHHVPYTYILHSGKTVVQTIYDSHYDGAEQAQSFPRRWKSLQAHIDRERFEAVLIRLEGQASHAKVWRDTINNFFFKLSAIPDDKGRIPASP